MKEFKFIRQTSTMLKTMIIILVLLLSSNLSFSVEPSEILSDAKLEQRAREVSAKTRCLVCQNQSIDESNAELARELRIIIREKITEGQTNKQVINFLISKYGEYVLLEPQFNQRTILLWLAPILLIVVGLFAGAVFLRRGRDNSSKNKDAKNDFNDGQVRKKLSSVEKKQIDKILKRMEKQ